jgi:hypothetical protein
MRGKYASAFWDRMEELPASEAARILLLDARFVVQTWGLFSGAWDGSPPWQTETRVLAELERGGGLPREWYDRVTPGAQAIQVLWDGLGMSMSRELFIRNAHLWWRPISDEICVVDITSQDWALVMEHEGEFRSMRRDTGAA